MISVRDLLPGWFDGPTYLHDTSMTAPAIPPGAKVRVVGDVHGDATGFAYAVATDRFIVQLGDLADHGPDSAATLRMMFDLVEGGRGLFILGNHDLKLARVLSGDHVRVEPVVQATIAQMDDTLKERTLRLVSEAPAWVRHGSATVRAWRISHGDAGASLAGAWAGSSARPDGAGRCMANRPGGCSRTDIRNGACAGWIGSRRA